MDNISLPDGIELQLSDAGRGKPVLLLHGGGGPRLMQSLATALAEDARVLLPTHPGFGGTPSPDWVDRVDDLALIYADLLDTLDLREVLVIGNSLGGWIAASLSLLAPARLRGVVLMNAAGIRVEGHEVTDVSKLAPPQLAELAYYEPEKFRFDPSKLSPAELAAFATNGVMMNRLCNAPYMHDPKLARRLRRAKVSALVIWGESDRIVDVEYGRAYARAFANGRFELVPKAGHMPQLEQPQRTLELIGAFDRSL
jgi:pimeloyl-ACP methyl ester carboxylesterase